MKSIIIKYLSYFFYVIFILITLFYIRVIISLCINIKATKNGGFTKLIDENSPIWYEQSIENMIMNDKIWIAVLVFFMVISSLYIVKRPKLAIFLLFVPYIVAIFIN